MVTIAALITGASTVNAAPLSFASGTFAGTFNWASGLNVQSRSVSGNIEFALGLDIPNFNGSTMDRVTWGFEAESTDGRLNFGGGFDNQWAWAHPTLPNNLTQFPWAPSYWTGSLGPFSETYSGLSFNRGDVRLFGADWIFATNEHFLPQSIVMSLADGLGGFGTLTLNLDVRPVPEPSVLLFLATGLGGALAARRRLGRS